MRPPALAHGAEISGLVGVARCDRLEGLVDGHQLNQAGARVIRRKEGPIGFAEQVADRPAGRRTARSG